MTDFNKPTNQPAFPTGTGITPYNPGMTLRDYMAAHAMQGICASKPSLEWSSDRLAAEAYDLADAMLKAREA
jgi:hypothetical protein